MSRKKVKKIEKEEVPSFLLELTAIPEDVKFHPRATNSDYYLGPIFFGECHQFSPPLHSLNLGTVRHIQKTYTAKENIQDLFIPKTEFEEKFEASKIFKPVFKRKHVYSDPYSHRCPGIRKSFVPEVKLPAIDLGESTSVIEGETILEVPLCRLRRAPSRRPETEFEFEFVKLSDVKEGKKTSKSYEERVSHVHYPKALTTVTVIGPAIPAAITITKLPSKRRTQSKATFLMKPKVKKASEDESEASERKTGEDFEYCVREQRGSEEEFSTREGNIEGESEKEYSHQKFSSQQSLAENEEEMEKVDEENTTEERGGEKKDTEIDVITGEYEEQWEKYSNEKGPAN